MVWTLARVALVAAFLLIAFPLGYIGYDPSYALVWGRELAAGSSPDYGAFLASTPHPLVDLFGAATSGLGPQTTLSLALVLSYLMLGLLADLVYRLAAGWFGRAIGAVAALLVAVSPIVVGSGLRGALDIPYVALCLAALLVESRRRRAGWPVLALLAVAGLLRPEAWLFSVVYWLYLAVRIDWPLTGDGSGRRGRVRLRARGERPASALIWLLAIVVAGPLIWGAFDLVTTGNPFYSFTSTRESVRTLARERGPVAVVLHGPQAVGQVIQWPAALASISGLAFGLWLLRRRTTLAAAAAVVALLAFALVGCGGLAILPRYAILSGTLLAIFAALGLLGWRLLERENPWRARWRLLSLGLVLFLCVWIPRQWSLDSEISDQLALQGPVERDLSKVAGAIPADACGTVAVPSYPAVPRVALATGIDPSALVEGSVPAHGYLLRPADLRVFRAYFSPGGDETRALRVAASPPGFVAVAADPSWRLYDRC